MMFRRAGATAAGTYSGAGPGLAGVRLCAAVAATAVAAAVAVLPATPAAAVTPVPPGSPVDQISLFGGTGTNATPVPGPAQSSPLGELRQMALDTAGNLYAADWTHGRIIKVTPAGILSIIAGNGTAAAMVPGPATSSPLNEPTGLAVDSAGNVYVSDYYDRIAKITPAGQLSFVAGDGNDNPPVPGPALSSPFKAVVALAVDNSGNLYAADNDSDVIVKITPAGQLSIVVGGGATSGPPVSPIPATDLDIDVNAIAVDAAGNLYTNDYSDCYAIKVSPTGTATHLAGTGSCTDPDNGPATSTPIYEAFNMSVDLLGNVYIADYYYYVVEKISPDGTMTVIGDETNAIPNYGGPMSGSSLGSGYSAVANGAGVIYFANDSVGTIDRIGPVGPSAPRDLRVTPGDGTLTLSFLPPYDTGTSPLDYYLVSLDGGTTWETLTPTLSGGRLTATIPSLTNGTLYPVRVQAVNGEYGSPYSLVVAGTPGVPAAGLAITGVKVVSIVGVGLLILLFGLSLVIRLRRRPEPAPAQG